ncbi:hypothetical protein BS17DRAFT_604500 [Gyrodon lividus]|nr:hypothetical protein BS17DRAFT_604500 [Gyrodon lividus]
MSSEKKFWPKLRSPFRSSLGIIQVSQPEAEAGRTSRSASRVSSVYLSDDSSAFVVVPEFDEPERTTPALPEESGHSSRRFRCLPREASSSSSSHNGVNSYFSGFNTGTGSSPCSPSSEAAGKSGSVCDVLAGAPSCHTHGTGQDYDLEQRLGSAYDYIRTMPSPVSPKVLLSSDPQMLRKQLGVPQHSVINYPIGCLPDLPNPHVSESHILSFKSKCAEETISYSPGPATPPNRHDDIVTDSLRFPLLSSREKLSLHINTGASTRHYPPTAFSQLPLQNTLAVTTGPASLDSAPPHQFVAAWSQCCAVTTQSPMGIHATRSPDPQSSQGKPSKLLKRRVGPHLVSPPVSPLSPTSQEASTSRGVWPRKPVTGSGPLPNGHERQESLPQLRTPSPFRVDLVSPFAPYRCV